MKKNIVKFAFAIIALGGTAHAQTPNQSARQRASREMEDMMRNSSSWIQFVSHEPQKKPMDGKKPTTAPVARDTRDLPRCITFEEFIKATRDNINEEFANALRDSTKWVKVSNPVMDTLPIKNIKTR